MSPPHPPLPEAIRHAAQVLEGGDRDYDALLRMVGDRAFVLLGEATHGTHEFYAIRAQITRRLIEECGFDAVAVEADWPDAYRLNRHVRGRGEDSIDDAFGDFGRFPAWMWRNHVVRAFIQWLKARNAPLPASAHTGFYGLDLYSLHRSAKAVIAYLERVDPGQAVKARRLHAGLNHLPEPQSYGLEATAGLRPPCHEAAAAVLVNLLAKRPTYLAAGGPDGHNEQFNAERNAHVVLNAEQYYRTMFDDPGSTWNLRDAHMTDMLFALHRHMRAQGRQGRIVVWAHNSHLGDARATDMGERGEWNVGQLLREQAGAAQTLLVGFTTYAGHVTAAREWDTPGETRRVRPARQGSCERLFHTTGLNRFFLPLSGAMAEALAAPLLQRAIGVVYRPETELASHYYNAALSRQFDALFHLDETRAVEPLDGAGRGSGDEPPDTYPSGL